MRKAGKIVAECHQLVGKVIRPGITTLEIDALVEKNFVRKELFLVLLLIMIFTIRFVLHPMM